MKILVLDTENTTHEFGNPFSRCNKCCIIPYHLHDGDSFRTGYLNWEYAGHVSRDYIDTLTSLVKDSELIVGFNLKYDLHWLRRYGILEYGQLAQTHIVWDCQLAQFIIRNQQERMPSLNSTCEFWGLGQKLDVVEREYWAKGLDTTDVPLDILSEYGMKDVDLTYQVYLKQQEYLKDKPKLARLIRLSMQDLLVLAEMEWNGLRYDVDESNRRAVSVDSEIQEIDEALKGILGNYPFNFNSNDQLSVILYGGTIKFDKATPYEYVLKTGQKAGQTVTRFNHEVTEVPFPRLAQPSDKSKLKKDGYWSTDDSSLSQLKVTGPAKVVVAHLKRRAELERLVSTYYRGFPKKMSEMDWPEGEVHSNLNQCIVVTGRLSSSNPNQQNIPPIVYELVKTRF